MSDSDSMTFRPTQTLLSVWIAATFLPCVMIGVAVGGACAAGGNAVAGFILTAGILLAVLVTYEWLYFNSIRYELDSQYVVRSSGVLWKVKRWTPLVKITNTDVRQGPLERLLKFGQIWIFTPSTGSLLPETKLIGVLDPHGVKRLIMERVERAKSGAAWAVDEGDQQQPRGAGNETVPVLREILDTLRRIESKIGKG